MASETEDKTLNRETVVEAFQFMIENSGLGKYYVYCKNSTNVVGCTMVTFGHELYSNKTVNWFQSVYVAKEHWN